MRLRNQLVYSYLGLMLVIIILVSYFVSLSVNSITDRVSQTTLRKMEDLTTENHRLAENILTGFGEEIVVLQAQNTALTLSVLLRGLDYTDHNLIRSSKELRETATKPIVTQLGIAGYMDLYDRQGNIIFHPNRELESMNYSYWSDEYPDMWILAQRSYQEELVTGYYSFLNQEGKSVKKYVAAVHVPDTDLNLSAAVEIDKYFLETQKEITRVSSAIKASATDNISSESSLYRRRILTVFFVIITIITILGFFMAIELSKFITRPLEKLTSGLIEKKDINTLTTDDNACDEIKMLVRTLTDHNRKKNI